MTTVRGHVGPTLPILLLLLLVTTVAAPAARAGDDEDNRAVHWVSYREAMSTGRGQKLPIILHFMAPWSDLNRKMERETYGDLAVIRYLNANFVAAQVDIERLPSLARKYDVESVPTVWFLDETGKPLTAVNGEVGPEKMLRVTKYINEKIYEHTDYETWLKKSGHR